MHLPAKEKLVAGAAIVALLGGASWVGKNGLHPDAPLNIEAIAPKAPPVEVPKANETLTSLPIATAQEVVVALAGSVKKPGLYHLSPNARVDDAIKAAGGSKPEADLEAINLAAKLVDGDQVYVPRKQTEPVAQAAETQKVPEKYRGGEVKPTYAPLAVRPKSTSNPDRGTKAKASGPVSLNTGSEAQLQTLPGVGASTAKKILAYRQEHGGFGSIEEIQAVKGIGPKKFEKMKPFLKL